MRVGIKLLGANKHHIKEVPQEYTNIFQSAAGTWTNPFEITFKPLPHNKQVHYYRVYRKGTLLVTIQLNLVVYGNIGDTIPVVPRFEPHAICITLPNNFI